MAVDAGSRLVAGTENRLPRRSGGVNEVGRQQGGEFMVIAGVLAWRDGKGLSCDRRARIGESVILFREAIFDRTVLGDPFPSPHLQAAGLRDSGPVPK